MPLNSSQLAVLKQVHDMPVSEKYRESGFPGNPDRYFDKRIVPVLERLGLVDCIIHRWRPQHDDKDRYTVCVRINDAGRNALAASEA